MRQIVVVGSGIAGLVAALELSREHDVTLVTKAALADSNTRWAQGGIAAVMFDDDSIAEHIADTLNAGAGLCDPLAVEVLCTEGPRRIRDLIQLGVAFDHQDGQLARGLEAAHTHARVLHAGGDATGLNLEMTLVQAVRAAKIRVLEQTFACDLVVEDERVHGVEVLREGRRETLSADAVILACGGAGQLYRHTTNPSVATGDGVALAMRAGAQLADIEFYQFHPTALATKETFLISEAVRGEGAVLLDAEGRRFMQAQHPDAELAPRDVVARSIARQMTKQGGRPVLLDATHLGPEGQSAEFLSKRFPTIDAAVRARGFDWSQTPVPVTPAAHYWMGGVRTDVWGRTSIAGLYAVGEVACTGVHGANRLASNSLLESLVFAWRCAEQLPKDDLHRWPEVSGAVLALELETERGARQVQRGELQALMWNRVGIERSADGLSEAAEQLMSWRGCDPDCTAVAELETANLLAIAKAMVTVALDRRESRGAHYRVDYPEPRVDMQHSIVCAVKVAVAV
jgi:L-aspartate oxidase